MLHTQARKQMAKVSIGRKLGGTSPWNHTDTQTNTLAMSACTSTNGHLPGPGTVGLADAVFRAPGQEEPSLAGVEEGVAKPWQVHPYHLHMGRALWLLTRVGWGGGRRGRGRERKNK